MLRELPVTLYLFIIFGLIAANFFIFRDILAPRMLVVTALEVGKGSATLVQTPDKKTILIDTGPDASILRALGLALPPWRRTIDAVILTSGKAGMTGGLADVTSRYHAPTLIRFGSSAFPYGASLKFNGISITVLAPNVYTIK